MPFYSTIIKTGLLLGLATAILSTAQAQQFYKWKDEKGATHYSQTPPPARNSQTLSIKARAATAAPATTPVAAPVAKPGASKDTAAKAPSTPPKQKLSAEACQQIKSNLELLQSGRRLYQNDAGGERSYITEEQKAVQIQTYTQNLAQGCS